MRDHEHEILEIKRICEKYGYGAVMSMASTLWKCDLAGKGQPISIAFDTAVITMLNDDGVKIAKESTLSNCAIISENTDGLCWHKVVGYYKNKEEQQMTREEAQLIADKYRKDMIRRVYRHFKGEYYVVIDVAVHSESAGLYVVYRAYDEKSTKTWIRPLDMFLSPVDKKKYPDVEQEERFKKIADWVVE